MSKVFLLTGIFIKKDVFKLSRIATILLPILAGATIIVGNSTLSHQFDTNMIIYMYTFIAQYLLLYFAVACWGIEYQKRTINLLKISGQSLVYLYIAKFIAYILNVLFFFLASFAEISLYLLVNGEKLNLKELFIPMLGSYFMYGGFVFGCATIIVSITKNMVISLVATWMLMSVAPAITMLLQNLSIQKFLQYIPFSFIAEVFNFCKFNNEQFYVTFIWIILLNTIGYFLIKKRGKI